MEWQEEYKRKPLTPGPPTHDHAESNVLSVNVLRRVKRNPL